jgi:hypothetical protein
VGLAAEVARAVVDSVINNSVIEANSIGIKNGMIVRARRPAPASP